MYSFCEECRKKLNYKKINITSSDYKCDECGKEGTLYCVGEDFKHLIIKK